VPRFNVAVVEEKAPGLDFKGAVFTTTYMVLPGVWEKQNPAVNSKQVRSKVFIIFSCIINYC
jgi:hypothetical protein